MQISANFHDDTRNLDTQEGYLLFGDPDERPGYFSEKSWEIEDNRVVVTNKGNRLFYYVFFGSFTSADSTDWESLTGTVSTFLELDYLNNIQGYDSIRFDDVNTDIQTILAADWLNLLATDDLIEGSQQDDLIQGYAGNDSLTGGQGQDYLSGGDGLDIAFFQGNLSDYSIQQGSSSRFNAFSDNYIGLIDEGVTVSDSQPNRDGIDFLESVERLYFNDLAIAFDYDGIPGQAFRLYQAAFSREPDLEGMGFWIAHLENGMTIQDAASLFIASPEFFSLYGNPSNGEFITSLYNNVLGRDPEPAGYAWWLDQINNNPVFTWNIVMVGFSESPENQANVLELIEAGITFVEWAL
ncbi:DUF4214 domain-containing protein [Marinobacterium litorale]|uniref:DUF4214 domain-containing protein n=1 Tax=Marinobacterium litorale TaxID=404770 RepID=UPI0003F70EC7|nr:DUF4214 domain-containing protein [Marinobacterium litorale]